MIYLHTYKANDNTQTHLFYNNDDKRIYLYEIQKHRIGYYILSEFGNTVTMVDVFKFELPEVLNIIKTPSVLRDDIKNSMFLFSLNSI